MFLESIAKIRLNLGSYTIGCNGMLTKTVPEIKKDASRNFQVNCGIECAFSVGMSVWGSE